MQDDAAASRDHSGDIDDGGGYPTTSRTSLPALTGDAPFAADSNAESALYAPHPATCITEYRADQGTEKNQPDVATYWEHQESAA